MKTKEQAFKILLDAGWTVEEILSVLKTGNSFRIREYPSIPSSRPIWAPPPQQLPKPNLDTLPPYSPICSSES